MTVGTARRLFGLLVSGQEPPYKTCYEGDVTSTVDSETGGCRDRLQLSDVNQNEGAESTPAWLLSLLAIHSLEPVEKGEHATDLAKMVEAVS